MIGSPFHTGLIVDDAGQAMQRLTAAFGLQWSSIRESETAVWTPAGRATVTFRGAFSLPGPFQLELIEAVPETIWDLAADMALHHISFWSSDLRQDSSQLEASGYPLVATGWNEEAPGVPALFAYHRRCDGPYLELLDGRERPHYEDWWSEAVSRTAADGCLTS